MANFITTQIMGSTMDTTDRYSNFEIRGAGSSGLVCSAKDKLGSRTVAIKKIRKPFETRGVAKRTWRELHLLCRMRHDNLINMTDVFISPSEDLYLVTDCISTDLHYLIHTRKQPLEGQFIMFFAYQILRGLKYIHSAGVIHRDLKPSNILINENCDVKICDFGLARGKEQQMTGYIATRYYRAPEVMLTWQKYSYSMDIWSVGCILAEMLTGQVLFPGKDHVNQFELVTELLGKPPAEVMEKVYSKDTLEFVDSLSEPHGQIRSRLSSRLGNVDHEAINLLEEMFDLDPEKRITAADALSHEYVAKYHDTDDEPVFEGELDWSLNDSELSVDQWKNNMYFEILDYHRGAYDPKEQDHCAKLNLSNWLHDEMMVETY